MEKLQVIHISTVHYWQDARILDKECKGLSENGFDVRLFIQHDGDKEIDGVHIEGLPLAEVKIHRLTRVIPKMLLKVIRADRKAILHLHDPELLIFGVLFKILGFKVIYDVHEDLPKDILDKEWIPSWLRKPISGIMKKLEFLATAAFDGVVSVTPIIHQRFQHIESALVRNFPKLDLFLQEEPEISGNYAVYVGDVRDIRGAMEMTQAINTCENDLELKLGGRVYPKGYENTLIQADARNRLELLGWIPHGEIPALLKQAICGLVVLHPLDGYKEAYSVKMFEYMAAGIPVIASNFPMWKEIIESSDCGVLVNPLDVNEIAEAIDRLAENREQAMAMGKRGREAAKTKYNWAQEEKTLVQFYENIVHK